MPTKTKEYSLYAPGRLVKNIADIYSSSPIDGGEFYDNRVARGTVGVILSGPKPTQGYKDHCQVQFLNNIVWWVRFEEIEPFH